MKFIQNNREHTFFLYLPPSAVYVPIHPDPEFAGKSGNGRYNDWVEETDWSVGRVLDTLRELHLNPNKFFFFQATTLRG